MVRCLRFAILAALFVGLLPAQDDAGLAAAKALDQEILKLKDLPDDARARAVRDLAARIREQPPEYALPLAFNLTVDGIESSGHGIVQLVASTLADALRRSSKGEREEFQYDALAQLARYGHAEVALNDPRYKAAMARLEEVDRSRGELNLSLGDLRGNTWSLKDLKGKVVLVNFWATWCPPCRRELPDLGVVYQRFRNQGLEILAISDEEGSILRPFVERENLRFPVLLDPGHKMRDKFRVNGVPASFVYDRAGHLVATALSRPDLTGWMDLLGVAGLQ